MSDVMATRLGFKEYLHGFVGGYNGGNAPTITVDAGDGTLSSVNKGVFMPYQTQSGSWRLKFNIDINVNSNSRSQMTMYVNGILFPSVETQAIAGSSNANIPLNRAQVNNGTNSFIIRHDTATTATYRYSGDVLLASKPTWAY